MSTGNSVGWDGSLESLPDDTMVSVSLETLRVADRNFKELSEKYEKVRYNNDTLIKLMKHFGKQGKSIFVKYDPFRDYNGKYFTVVISDPHKSPLDMDKTWRMDTDNPIEAFCEYIRTVER